MLEDKKIFISPLDWGLGHTTRCIPIIKALQKLGFKIWIGVNEVQKKLLEQELSNVNYIPFKGYNISYPSSKNMAIKMGIQIPKILNRINSEKKELDKLIEKHGFDLVISDNRFGLHSTKIPSIYISHQINIQAPFGVSKVLYNFHEKYIANFTQCWIPDYKEVEESLGGKLSHGRIKDNYHYLGLLSRFDAPALETNLEYQYLAIISGPEPQRSIFEKKIIDLFESKKEKCAILGGKPLEEKAKIIKNIDYYSHLETNKMMELISLSKNIICRPGYSSIMDLSVLQKPVLFVPTPGQTEQEYLAQFYFVNYGIQSIQQNKLSNRINETNFKVLPFKQANDLEETLDLLLKIMILKPNRFSNLTNFYQ